MCHKQGQGHKKTEQRDIEDVRLDRGAVATSQGNLQLPETDRSWNSLNWSSTPDAACSDSPWIWQNPLCHMRYESTLSLSHTSSPDFLASPSLLSFDSSHIRNSCKHLLSFPPPSISPNQVSLMLLPLSPSSLWPNTISERHPPWPYVNPHLHSCMYTHILAITISITVPDIITFQQSMYVSFPLLKCHLQKNIYSFPL